MPKTITMRIDDHIYEILKKAADGERRSISNFIEYATLAYLTNEIYVDDDEMSEILENKGLIANLNKGLTEIKKGKYKIVKEI